MLFVVKMHEVYREGHEEVAMRFIAGNKDGDVAGYCLPSRRAETSILRVGSFLCNTSQTMASSTES